MKLPKISRTKIEPSKHHLHIWLCRNRSKSGAIRVNSLARSAIARTEYANKSRRCQAWGTSTFYLHRRDFLHPLMQQLPLSSVVKRWILFSDSSPQDSRKALLRPSSISQDSSNEWPLLTWNTAQHCCWHVPDFWDEPFFSRSCDPVTTFDQYLHQYSSL